MTVVTRLCQVTDTINLVYAKFINIKLNHNENLKKRYLNLQDIGDEKVNNI